MARLYRTVGGKIVEEGHPEAAFLVVGDNCKVPPQFADAVAEYRASGPDDDSDDSDDEWPAAETSKPKKRAAKRAASSDD